MSDLKQLAANIRDSVSEIDKLIDEAETAVASAHDLLERLSNEVEEQRELARKGSVAAFETPAAALEWIGDRLQAELDGWE